MNTAGLQHDLSDLFHAAAAGEGLLSAVQHHKDNLAGSGDTDGGTAGSVAVIAVTSGDADLTVFDQGGTEAANTLLDPALVGLIIVLGSDHGRTVLQDSEEAAAVNRVPFHTVHYQQTARLARSHVIAVGIDAGDHVVILDVVLAFGVSVFLLSGNGLVKDTGHAPLAGIIVFVVDVDLDIIPGQIRSGQIEHHLLVVGGHGHLDLLRNAGRQNGLFL